jgi:uncharacterized protein
MRDAMADRGRPTATEIAEMLGLVPLPGEGGFYRETWRADEVAPAGVLPHHPAERHVGTAILFMVTDQAFSALHRLAGPEIWFFHDGDPAELILLHPDGQVEVIVLGRDLTAGERPQVVVPGGVWQACSVTPGGEWTLTSTTMSPGFHHDDFELGDRADLLAGWPSAADRIRRLTRE